MNRLIQRTAIFLVKVIFYAGIILSAGGGGALIFYIATRNAAPGWTFYRICMGGGVAFAVFASLLMIIVGWPDQERPGGVELEKNELIKFQDLVKESAERLGVAPPDKIVILFYPLAAAREFFPFRNKGMKTLFIGWPLLILLTQDELKAILGHELAHFDNSAFIFHQTVWKMEAVIQSVKEMTHNGNILASDSVLAPMSIALQAYLKLFGLFFLPFTRSFRKKFEFYCDERSARCFGADNLQSAFSRIVIMRAVFQKFVEQSHFARITPGFFARFSRYYEHFPLTEMFSIILREQKRFSEDHPSMMERTKRLSVLPKSSNTCGRLQFAPNELDHMEMKLIEAFPSPAS